MEVMHSWNDACLLILKNEFDDLIDVCCFFAIKKKKKSVSTCGKKTASRLHLDACSFLRNKVRIVGFPRLEKARKNDSAVVSTLCH